MHSRGCLGLLTTHQPQALPPATRRTARTATLGQLDSPPQLLASPCEVGENLRGTRHPNCFHSTHQAAANRICSIALRRRKQAIAVPPQWRSLAPRCHWPRGRVALRSLRHQQHTRHRRHETIALVRVQQERGGDPLQWIRRCLPGRAPGRCRHCSYRLARLNPQQRKLRGLATGRLNHSSLRQCAKELA